jgi:hypothetical protein
MKEKYVHEWIYKRNSNSKTISLLLPLDIPKLEKGNYVIKLYKLERDN